MRLILPAVLAIALAAPVAAQPLTIRPGESWVFALEHGQPARARQVESKASPAPGEVKVSVFLMMGTSMTATSNNPDAYTFKAELVGPRGRVLPARTCTLPGGGRPLLETWPQKARAVRIGDFRPALDPGAC